MADGRIAGCDSLQLGRGKTSAAEFGAVRSGAVLSAFRRVYTEQTNCDALAVRQLELKAVAILDSGDTTVLLGQGFERKERQGKEKGCKNA